MREEAEIRHPPLLIREATKQGYTKIYDGEVFDISYPTSNTRRGRRMSTKVNNLMAKPIVDFCRYKNARIRRLTPTECARLQTIPTWYKFRMIDKKGNDVPASDTNVYRVLGNGWTVKVIQHIFSFLPKEIKEK